MAVMAVKAFCLNMSGEVGAGKVAFTMELVVVWVVVVAAYLIVLAFAIVLMAKL